MRRTRRPRTVAAITAGVLLCAVTVTACGSDGRDGNADATASPTVAATPTAAGSTPSGPAGYDGLLEAQARQYGITDPPVVEVVRVVEPAEQPALIEECMAEAGFESDGGGWAVPVDQKDALGLAMYICYAQYPIDDKYLTPLTDIQREKIYRYWVDVRSPCLEDMGYEIPDPPTLESWLAGGEDWAPHYYLGHLSVDEAQVAQTRCPENPPDLYEP